ncbi:TcfC E-set like domain-containing protein [Photobacterium leiognathi]|uniref:TcfC E-set like domain-containing protein n=1 Tax=Photobacterium leiognathi TaxID=553611 RepID=UPI00273A4A72|nr:TcfC E-set like domain-containing protein [Photobacterium leiognathi]
MKKYLLVAIGLNFYSVTTANASDYPLEFTDFFEKRKENVEVIIVGSKSGTTISADVSYDLFQLPNNIDSIDTLNNYLESKNISDETINKIVNLLSKGINSNPNCKTLLSKCIPTDIPNEPEFVFDYDAKLLKIFVSTDMFDSFSNKKEYFAQTEQYNALINKSNLYLYGSSTYQSLSWRNETTIGLPYGNFEISSQLRNQSDGNEFDFTRAIYNYEHEDIRFLIGYQDQNSITFNTTDFLNYGSNYAGLGASLGSSVNLLKGDKKAYQRLHFYSPQGGQLEVYQGDKLILNRVVAAGEQSIGYDQIPSGVYTITLKLKQGKDTVLEENKLVINNRSLSLPVGDIDYRFDVGSLDTHKVEDELDSGLVKDKLDTDLVYIRGLSSYRPYEGLLLGVGVISSGDNTQVLLGSNHIVNNTISFQYTLGLFSNNDQYQLGQLNVAPATFSVRKFEHNELDNVNSLSRALYGEDNFTEYSAGLSSDVLFGRAFINYFRYKRESDNSYYDNLFSVSDNISLTWTKPLFGGEFSINSTYTKTDNFDMFNTGLSWRKRFGKGISGQVDVNFEDDNYSNIHSAVAKEFSYDNNQVRVAAGVRSYSEYQDISDLSLSLSGDNKHINYDAYGYIDTSGNRSISGTLSGTQVISTKSVKMTNKRGDVFAEFAPYWNEKKQNQDARLNYGLYKNNRFWFNEQVTVGGNKIVDIPAYSEIDIQLDVNKGNVDTKLSKDKFFTTPGKYYTVRNSVTPLLSQIFILNDMNGEPIPFARCIGDGCKNMEELSSDGVFRVNYVEGQPFKLISEKRLCVYDEKQVRLHKQDYIQAYCLPGLDDLEGQNVYNISTPEDIKQNRESQALVYVGKYEYNKNTDAILSRLSDNGLIAQSINVGDTKYIYVKYNSEYTTVQRTLLDELDAYVILDSINTDQLFTTR